MSASRFTEIARIERNYVDEFDKHRAESEKRINLIAIQLISNFENGKAIPLVKDGNSLDIVIDRRREPPASAGG